MKELERCPYCGSTHVRTTSVEVEAGRNHWAFCAECLSSGPTSPSEQEAARRWNEVARCRAEVIEGRGDLLDLRCDLGVYEENPLHYKGDGTVSCARAMRSMLKGWERFAEPIANEPAYWATAAFKYLWRFPLKGHPREDLRKALDCCQRALEAWGDAE